MVGGTSISLKGHWHAEAWQGDGRQAKLKNKINISNFPGSLPGRLFHLHFTALGATIPLPDRTQERERKELGAVHSIWSGFHLY